MPIYAHEIGSGLRRTVTALPLFSSAATNAVVLGATIVLVVLAMTLVFGPKQPGPAATARGALRSFLYSLPPVFFLLHVYGGTVAAAVEGGAAGQLEALVTGPVHEVMPRAGGAAALPPAAPAAPAPAQGLAGLADHGSSVSEQLRDIEARLNQI